MKKLTLNLEYAKRHLFVALLLLALGLWFGYDGVVRYPSTPAAELYKSIEGVEPNANMDVEAFKRQKTQTQYGFTFLSLLASFIVGTRLRKAQRFTFEYDDAGFAANGVRHGWEEVDKLDLSRWEKKSILLVVLKDGAAVWLDGWHHLGVREFLDFYNQRMEAEKHG